MKKKVVYLCFFLITGLMVKAQVFQSTVEVSEDLNYRNISDDTTAVFIFNSLASSFNLSPNRIRINASGVFHLVLDKISPNHLMLNVSFHKRTLTGKNEFQGFSADSVLWPGQVATGIQVYNGRHLRNTMSFSCPTDGTSIQLDVSEFANGRIGELALKIDQVQYSFRSPQKLKAMEWISQVQMYYSYHALLTAVNAKYQQHANENHRSSANLMIDHIELGRLKWLLEQESFVQNLHIDRFDPEGLLIMREQLNRFANRASTLFDQEMRKNEVVEPDYLTTFCRQYVALSTNYLKWAETHQPSVASALVMMASIPQQANELGILREIIQYFASGPNHAEMQIPICISELYAREARQLNDVDDYVYALLLLRNAAFIQTSFSLPSNHGFNTAYLAAFDGVAASYLKVGRMACLSNNSQLSRNYFQRVYGMIDSHLDFLTNMVPQDSALPGLFREIISLNKLPSLQFSYTDKVQLFDKTTFLAQHVGRAWYPAIDSAYRINLQGYLDQQLDIFEWMLNQNQFPDAGLKLASIDAFLKGHADFYLTDTIRLYQLAKQLFEVYIQQSDRLLLAGQPGVALEQLVMADKIGDWLPYGGRILIDHRIDSVAFPLIETMVEKAKYYIWALRLPEATTKLAEADSIEKLYLDGTNSKATELLSLSHQELAARNCMVVQQKLESAINEIRAALRARAFTSVEKVYESVQDLKSEFEGCDLNAKKFLLVEQACQPIVSYLDQNRQVKKLLFERGYSAAIDHYVNLLKYILAHQLDTMGIVLPSLYTFVGEQKLSLLTITTTQYYIDKGNYQEALQYLWMARKQKIKKADMRHLMGRIAEGLAQMDKKSDASVGEALENYTGNDKWFSYFNFTYRKNRLF
ncbi:MAG: hypothetical protein A2W85_10685 [Bacteroidetes bacterium GWF2_41_31]|nr:MAG: hypothetical protein A2W85_10685 [Bacteroidetes bacterium GWF2_41_31]